MAGVKYKKTIRLSKSCLNQAEKKAVIEVLNHEYLGMGEEVLEFEKALGDFFGIPVVCVVNGTAALHLSLQACEIGEGDEVIVPSLTYVASFQAISATGAKPVACDIDPESFLIDINDAKKRITEKTKAIMPVHYTGGVGDLDSTFSFAKTFNLRVIEDAAHAFGTTYKEKLVGSFGDISCFSFDGIKNITSGEGGCVVTNDVEVLNRIRDARMLGVEKDSEKRFSGLRSWDFDVTRQGWRYHMSNIMAAIGIEQLKNFNNVARIRQKICKSYDTMFETHPQIITIPRDYNSVVPHIYAVRIKGLKDRVKLQSQLLEQGIQTGYHYKPNHFLSLYHDAQASPMPVTELIFQELLSLPLHQDLTENEVDHIVNSLKRILV